MKDAVLDVDCWHKLKPITASADRSVRLWKVEESAHLIYRGHHAPIDKVAILTEDMFVSGSQDGSVALWSHGKKTPISVVRGCHGVDDRSHTARWITSLATLKASDTVASGSYDGYIRVHSARDGKLIPTVQVPIHGCVNGLAITSRIIVAGCSREHRLGRWLSLPRSSKDRLTIIRFPEDMLPQVEESSSDDDGYGDESDIDDQLIASSDSDQDK